MNNMKSSFPVPFNEPVKSYLPGSSEREELLKEINKMEAEQIEIPLIIGGKEIKTGNTGKCIVPHDHQHCLATYHKAGEKEVREAIEAAKKAKKSWERMPYTMRGAIFLRAAELLANKYRYTLNGATMLNQGKNVFQAEIDSACELIDFLRFNVAYMEEIYQQQPPLNGAGVWNQTQFRALEGFVFAITPFNFTAIGGNLPTAPAMMGNTVLWKPASTAVFATYYFMRILKEAGLPDGVINFIPGSGAQIGDMVLNSPDLAGVHFTGSTKTFQHIWKTIGTNIEKYHTYPRIVGETGGKDFIFAHSSTDIAALNAAVIRGAFEYQGQKCSAASRAYVPKAIWPDLEKQLKSEISTLKMGDVKIFSNFINAVIDQDSFTKIKSYIEYAQDSSEAEIIIGGNCDDSTGYFIEPTVVVTSNPHFKLMEEEIFGPVITIFLYEENQFIETLKKCDQTSPYGLTGAIFANDREAINIAQDELLHSAGNFYINDKPTGAVVGQQPFGGGRGSGTNDKAGSAINLMKWVSCRAIKENLNPPTNYRYPFLQD
ncbi:MAG: L-glutamate gamma-semialdehyde dehydrogenase [Spirochaetes bacterium]|nr:L-glutamate gamma-semialdehyde dehydrogenase [Spirochaetota bacterium]